MNKNKTPKIYKPTEGMTGRQALKEVAKILSKDPTADVSAFTALIESTVKKAGTRGRSGVPTFICDDHRNVIVQKCNYHKRYEVVRGTAEMLGLDVDLDKCHSFAGKANAKSGLQSYCNVHGLPRYEAQLKEYNATESELTLKRVKGEITQEQFDTGMAEAKTNRERIVPAPAGMLSFPSYEEALKWCQEKDLDLAPEYL